MANTTSPSLLLRIRDPKDQDAWEQFLVIYTPVVRSYCHQRKLQDADTNDVIQDVMTSVAGAIKAFEYDPARGRFRAWFGTITANKIKTLISKQNNRNGRTEGMIEASRAMESTRSENYTDPDSDWIAIFSERVLEAAVSRVRNEFAESTWACFEATWLKRQPTAEVAEALTIPIQSVYVNKSRVLKRLETEVRRLAEDTPLQSDLRNPG